MNYYCGANVNAGTDILNFDWGSQSIAQSKFQRAPLKGKDFQQEFLDDGRQYLLEIIFLKEQTTGKFLPPFSTPSLRSGEEMHRREGGTCKLRKVIQDLF
jgi:hypothetical protein